MAKNNDSKIEGICRLKNVRGSAQKARLVANMIRGKSFDDAFAFLSFSPLKASKIMKKVLLAAQSSLQHDKGSDVDSSDMIIHELTVNEGRTLKRMRPRARGRSARILKRSCHIELKLKENV